MSGTVNSSQVLHAEAAAFARYLLGREPGPEITARYAAAHEFLPAETPAARDAAVLGFARRHPRTIGLLDAASGILRPGSLLRRKLLLTTAILEATTRFAPDFLGRRASGGKLVLALAFLGTVGVLRAGLGIPLLVFVELAGRRRA